MSPEELKNPKSTISDSTPVLKETKHYYIKLNEYEEFLRNWITVENKDKWKANVIGQVKSWLDSGLKPRAVTRDLDWGIPVKVDGDDGKVLYVWFEAPIGYISSTKEWAKNNNKDWEDVPNQIKRWNKAGGKVLQGLIRRREAEALLFEGKEWHEV